SERSLQVREEIKKVKVPEDLELARLGVDIIGVRSDYGPFYYRRIPFLFFSTGEHPDYHTPQDTLERLDITKAARVSTVMSQVAFRMANTEEEIIWNGEVSPDLEEVRAVNRVATHFLKADAANQFEMTDLQRFFLTQVKSKTNYMIRNNQVSDNERKWLVRATQIMMLTLF
ncbi:MAG: M28 family peptidase, partial [Planctomicrobium sp.]|nr:M28 family peptidase [Planctomicrobium sp.]